MLLNFIFHTKSQSSKCKASLTRSIFYFRGARHGHKMKAKLQRIADMEEMLLKELQTKNSTPDADVSEKKKDKKKKKKSDKKDSS